ncbi:hypothetical protein CCACVL1_09211, partial [Corchorus capsularis]
GQSGKASEEVVASTGAALDMGA